MANFPQDLRTLITGTTAVSSLVSTRVHYNSTPQHSTHPQIWFRTNSDTEERTLDGTGGLHEALLDIECLADTETSSQNVADALKTLLDGYRGTVGSHTAKMFLSDKDDDYVPKSIDSDDGRHVVAFEIRAFYTT